MMNFYQKHDNYILVSNSHDFNSIIQRYPTAYPTFAMQTNNTAPYYTTQAAYNRTIEYETDLD